MSIIVFFLLHKLHMFFLKILFQSVIFFFPFVRAPSSKSMCPMLCSNTAPQPEPARQHYPLLVGAVWRNRLRWYYAGGLSANAHFTLIPAVCGTYGGWNPEFALWWR